jgi:hypothetical protein
MSALELSFANHWAACGSYMKTSLLFVLILSVLSLNANADDLDCDGGSHREEMDISVPNLTALKPTLVPDDHACAVNFGNREVRLPT